MSKPKKRERINSIPDQVGRSIAKNAGLKLTILVLAFFGLSNALSAQERLGIVSVPVADLRTASGTVSAVLGTVPFDPNEESQLLYGEIVKIHSESGDWMKVEALEQEEFSHNNRWEGYPGWVEKKSIVEIRAAAPTNFVVQKKIARLYEKPELSSESIPLSVGTRLFGYDKTKNGFRKIKRVDGKEAWILEREIRPSRSLLPEEELRKKIVQTANEFLGDYYFWGGRSANIPELKNQVTAVDCSGLVNLAYRVIGKELPRDSYEQFLRAKKIEAKDLKPGDLIFSASKEQPQKITHVSLYLDPETVLEAPKTGEKVRTIRFEEKFGLPIDKVEPGKPFGEKVLYFGTFF